MKILLTNDDGINTERLKFTEEVLLNYGDVIVVAPKYQQSAKSMSLTIGSVEYQKLSKNRYAVSGTPVDCINFAIQGLEMKPDLIVSGINEGYNIGIDTRYSGTVGACFQGQYFGFKTLALSGDRKGDEIIKNELKTTLDYIFDKNILSKEYTVNVNFPREKFGQSKGILEGRTYHRQHKYSPKLTETTFSPNRSFSIDSSCPKDTDIYAYHKGYTSICKIKV
jgi:5'-nucleotidase